MSKHPARLMWLGVMLTGLALWRSAGAQPLEIVDVEAQPLARNVTRLLEALEYLGAPLPADMTKALMEASRKQDVTKIQKLLDAHVLVQVTISPESRVKAKRGPGDAGLQQGGYTPVLLKVVNEAGVTKVLQMRSPQARPIYSGGAASKIAKEGVKVTKEDIKDRFLAGGAEPYGELEIFNKPPMADRLSGLKVEYVVALLHSSQAGKREATLAFDVGQGSQDIGFRAEVPVLFTIRPAIPVKLTVIDHDGKPTTGRFTFRDKTGKVYPPKSKRLAPDFFFQDQVYRHSGQTVLLPPGELEMAYGRGPEYRLIAQKITVPDKGPAEIKVKLQRWINSADYGWYSGDHHIHAAGCAHYTNPTEGVFAEDMFLHCKGEALNVGCNLTWGPCFDFQRQFFEPVPHKISEPFTVLKYDIEVSGFGSQLLGHVCLLNLRDQEYPGSDGTKEKGWPKWSTPLMRWAKGQGAYCGYAHSASGLGINPKLAANRKLRELDADKDGKISPAEAGKGLLHESFEAIDTDKDGLINQAELFQSIEQVRNKAFDFKNPHIARTALPNLVVPQMDGIGAQEICVTTAQGLCDFISAMDTARVPEWNCWYHIMNCGFPLKASGETDFPCISGSRVGQGRVYVQLGKIERIDFSAWAEGLAKGRSYVSDGYAHALEYTVNGKPTGETIKLAKGGTVSVKAKVAFAADTPLGTSVGGQVPQGKMRLVEVIVNGRPVASKQVPADDQTHDLTFNINIDRSSWVALRHFPQMHTNPVNVIVDDRPIRASRKSALWCIGTIEQLWRERGDPAKLPISAIDGAFPTPQRPIPPHEIEEAHRTFVRMIEVYRKIAAECPEGS